MLVLSRKKKQSILVDGGIEIEVLQIQGGTVKLGIKAPNDVRIVRGELELYSDLAGAGESALPPEYPLPSKEPLTSVVSPDCFPSGEERGPNLEQLSKGSESRFSDELIFNQREGYLSSTIGIR